MAKLKAGVIGLGMGYNHLRGYMTHPDVEVVAVADRQEGRRERAKQEFQIEKVYAEGIDLIRNEKLDILSVAVPNNQHKELTIAGLKAGAHVFCEKPMAMNAAEAEEMLATAKECNRQLGIDFSYRFTPQSRAMKALVEEGRLGEIYYARSVWLRRRGVPGGTGSGFNTEGASGSWFYDRAQSGGGPLIDLGVHRLDLALWMMGYPEVAWVMGSTYNKIAPALVRNYTVEDFACAMIKFRNGATLELDASWTGNIKENEQMSTRLLGDKGGIYQYNLNEGYTYDVEYYQEIDGKQYDCKLHPPVPEVRSAYHMFADAIRDNTPFMATGGAGRDGNAHSRCDLRIRRYRETRRILNRQKPRPARRRCRAGRFFHPAVDVGLGAATTAAGARTGDATPLATVDLFHTIPDYCSLPRRHPALYYPEKITIAPEKRYGPPSHHSDRHRPHGSLGTRGCGAARTPRNLPTRRHR